MIGLINVLRQFAQSHQAMLQWMALLSLVLFVGTLLAVPAIIVRLPADYFSHHRRHSRGWRPSHPLLRWIFVVAKNLVGAVFVLAGVVMLVLPGQGLLTIVLGVALLDFPGKYRLERWLIRRGPVIKSINWIRRRAGRVPMETEEGGRMKAEG